MKEEHVRQRKKILLDSMSIGFLFYMWVCLKCCGLSSDASGKPSHGLLIDVNLRTHFLLKCIVGSTLL